MRDLLRILWESPNRHMHSPNSQAKWSNAWDEPNGQEHPMTPDTATSLQMELPSVSPAQNSGRGGRTE